MVEAVKFGFAQRTELGDPDFVDIEARIKELTGKELAALVRHNISDVLSSDQ